MTCLKDGNTFWKEQLSRESGSTPEQMCLTNYTVKRVSKEWIEFQSALAPISERNCIPLNLMFSISW